MNLTPEKLFPASFLLAIALQSIAGNFPYTFFNFPLNAILGLLWMALLWYGYTEQRSSALCRTLLSGKSTVWTLGWFMAGCLVIGLFPQLSAAEADSRQGIFATLGCYNFMSSWIFVTGLFWLLTHLGLITIRRYFTGGKNKWRFLLNHGGLWIALFAGFTGSASEQTLRIPVYYDHPNNEAVSADGQTVFLDKALQLVSFSVEHYPNGTPRHFSAIVTLGEKNITLEVNHPHNEYGIADYYLTAYDMQSEKPRYCIVQIVREPMKYPMLAGILLMLCGGILLFIKGADISEQQTDSDKIYNGKSSGPNGPKKTL